MSLVPTYRSRVRRAGAAVWQALEDHPWIPYVVVGIALVIINS